LGGGLPRGTLAVIMGPPGSGKTTLASQIGFAAAHRGQQVLLLTAFSESTVKLLAHLQTYRFFSADLVGSAVQIFSLKQFLSNSQQEEVTAQEIIAAVRQTKASMVVLDGFQSIRGMEAKFATTRQLLYDLGLRLSLLGTTTLITTEADPRDPTLFPEMTTGDVLIGMYYTLEGMRSFRTLEVIKVRGGAPLPGRHSLSLSDEGVAVFPRLEARVPMGSTRAVLLGQVASAPQERARFDLAEMDILLGGGLPYRTTTLIAGSLGVGKTLLALQFALAGVSRGEPAVYLGFRETLDQLLLKAEDFDLGKQFREALAPDGLLTLQRWEPVELDPDRVAAEMLEVLERTHARRVVIDSIVEMERAVRECSGEERIPNYIAALLATLRDKNVTTLIVQETRKTLSIQPDFSADPLAIQVENLVLLQHLAYRGKLHRVLSILKMRSSAHDHAFREFQITSPEGIHVFSLYESEAGILEGLVDLYEKGGWGNGPHSGRETTSER
ncbi:MAG TPA: ATPase domain-containing protein, partial [Ktedonobacteraceae bacterium]|nr:ATPase domain-containing protein [Ktedonobacteraceae bacterium]